jgi:hypothetical protein
MGPVDIIAATKARKSQRENAISESEIVILPKQEAQDGK